MLRVRDALHTHSFFASFSPLANTEIKVYNEFQKSLCPAESQCKPVFYGFRRPSGRPKKEDYHDLAISVV
jgi:hypothetical protein